MTAQELKQASSGEAGLFIRNVVIREAFVGISPMLEYGNFGTNVILLNCLDVFSQARPRCINLMCDTS